MLTSEVNFPQIKLKCYSQSKHNQTTQFSEKKKSLYTHSIKIHDMSISCHQNAGQNR